MNTVAYTSKIKKISWLMLACASFGSFAEKPVIDILIMYDIYFANYTITDRRSSSTRDVVLGDPRIDTYLHQYINSMRTTFRRSHIDIDLHFTISPIDIQWGSMLKLKHIMSDWRSDNSQYFPAFLAEKERVGADMIMYLTSTDDYLEEEDGTAD